jgi:hypothetical protein
MRKALVRYTRSQGDETTSFGNQAPAQFNLPLDPALRLVVKHHAASAVR